MNTWMSTWDGNARYAPGEGRRRATLDGLIFEGVALLPYEQGMHDPFTQSFQRPNVCAHGGRVSCQRKPEFSIISPGYSVSTCPDHMFGAIQEARERSGLHHLSQGVS